MAKINKSISNNCTKRANFKGFLGWIKRAKLFFILFRIDAYKTSEQRDVKIKG